MSQYMMEWYKMLFFLNGWWILQTCLDQTTYFWVIANLRTSIFSCYRLDQNFIGFYIKCIRSYIYNKFFHVSSDIHIYYQLSKNDYNYKMSAENAFFKVFRNKWVKSWLYYFSWFSINYWKIGSPIYNSLYNLCNFIS